MKEETAIFAAGCFWCLEAQFKHLKGVKEIIPGFIGGTTENPTYKEVCTGTTGHAESCRIIYDAAEIDYNELLLAFFQAHDPTQLNRQGNDIGTQYRSAVFYLDEQQKHLTESCIQLLLEKKVYSSPIVTQVVSAGIFYPAEDYHKDYFSLHGENPYCQFVVRPKVAHFLEFLERKGH